ncbi:unnamed protein product, partial [Cuscuta epithymum]
MHFMIGMTFANAKEARSAIANYSVAAGVKLKIDPNEPQRIRAKCVNEVSCPFNLYISKDGKNQGLAVKTLINEHKCFRHYSLNTASASWLAKYFKDKIYKNPKYTAQMMKDDAEKELKINVATDKCKRAKRQVIQELDGSFKVEFSYLAAYAASLKRSNPGTKAEIDLDKEALKEGRRVFRRMFICFESCKRNWLNGCRPLIGLDGCFLKGVTKGQLLAAVGVDGNDQMVPIAWAVVDKENKNNWKWFLCWLAHELDLDDGSRLTLISDMQKGLLGSIQLVVPQAEHRWCARHVWANWSKKWNGGELKKKFWICAWSTFEEEFKENLEKMGKVSKKAAESLVWYPPSRWCRAYFSRRCHSQMVDNNITESFNSWILEARHKPIISMLEEIRTKAMIRIKENKKLSDKWFNN